MLDGMALDQYDLFIQIMKNNYKKIMKVGKDLNLVHQLWLRLGASQILSLKMLEWPKLVEICMVWVLGFIRDEWFQHPFILWKPRCIIDWTHT
jgi:hypothetical protein